LYLLIIFINTLNSLPFKTEPIIPFPDDKDGNVEEEARLWSDKCIYECRICTNVSYANYASLFDHIRYNDGFME
jgi:hypothetical protein